MKVILIGFAFQKFGFIINGDKVQSNKDFMLYSLLSSCNMEFSDLFE